MRKDELAAQDQVHNLFDKTPQAQKDHKGELYAVIGACSGVGLEV